MKWLIKRKKAILLCMAVIFFVLIYLIMLYDTQEILYDFNNCIADNVLSESMKETELYRFYNRNELYDNLIVSANTKVRRIFVLHNFNKGMMLVNYDCEAFDAEGNSLYSSSNVYARWYIEKKNGKWLVVDVKEQP